MTLDIGIAENDTVLYPSRETPTVSLGNDGYYWFLHPLFEELQEQTGQYADLYGDAAFSGATLDAFSNMLSKAKNLVCRHPKTWDVHIGTQMAPDAKELYSTVDKSEFLSLLRQLDDIAVIAAKTDCRVVCFGD